LSFVNLEGCPDLSALHRENDLAMICPGFWVKSCCYVCSAEQVKNCTRDRIYGHLLSNPERAREEMMSWSNGTEPCLESYHRSYHISH